MTGRNATLPPPAHKAITPRLRTGLAVLLLACGCAGSALADTARTGTAVAPAAPTWQALGVHPATALADLLAGLPACRAAQADAVAEQALHRQLRAGSAEWVLQATATRVSRSGPDAGRAVDHDLALEGALRLPGKAALHDGLGQARAAQAQAQTRSTCTDGARQLLDELAHWQRTQATAQAWQQQAELLKRQQDAVARRQQLGDAAVLEGLQAQAAWQQARHQADAQRLLAEQLRQALQARHSGLQLHDGPMPVVNPRQPEAAAWLDGVLDRHPDLAVARLDAAAARQQARVEQAETRPDPTLALRWGRARSSGEQTLGLSISVPLGGDARQAGADAAAARALAAQWRLDDVQQRLRRTLQQHLVQADAAQRARDLAHQAWRLQDEVATRLARGYALGEGALADLLSAHRLAHEQRLQWQLAVVDDAHAQAQLALDDGRAMP